MFKNAIIYTIEHWDRPGLEEIEERLEAATFVPCGPTDSESSGFVLPRGDVGNLVERVGPELVLKLCTETKAVPGGAVKDELERRLDAIEQETGRRPKGKRAKELKEEVVRDLLPRAFPKRSAALVWLSDDYLVIDAGSMKKADQVITRLVELLGGGFRVGYLQTQLAPATAMAAWLADKEAPAGFTIDRDCELKQPDSEKAAVRYARHTLELDEVGEHIRQGKLPTKLALTWNSRASFVLTEGLALKKVKLLDVVLDEASTNKVDDSGFEGDIALITGELKNLIGGLIEALGGELAREGDAA